MFEDNFWREVIVSVITILVVTLIVAFLFAFIYPIEKRKGNLQIGEIIRCIIKKLV